MPTYDINGKTIELDTSKEYYDFHVGGGMQMVIALDFPDILSQIQSNQMSEGEPGMRAYLSHLRRWKEDVPRIRHYRSLIVTGVYVLSTEQIFDCEGGEEIINKLENTGVLADYLLQELYNA